MWLKKSPRVYSLLKRAYYAGLYFIERYVLGTKLHEVLWRFRSFEESARESQDHPHRLFLVDRMRRFAPFKSILEVGCSAGPNLIALGRAYPAVRLYGVDISTRAIKFAKTVLAQEPGLNVTVFVGRADDLRRFRDRSIDIVLTDATLMYVGADKITRALSELARVGRKGLILNEWHLFEGHSAGQRSYWHYAHWVHDYRHLVSDVPGVKAVHVERLPPGLWDPGGGWEAYGALVEVHL